MSATCRALNLSYFGSFYSLSSMLQCYLDMNKLIVYAALDFIEREQWIRILTLKNYNSNQAYFRRLDGSDS